MAEIGEGDPDALRVLMDRHWDGLVTYAARMLRSTDDAEDVAQEVFLRVWEYRSRWRPGGSVRAYLYQIARSLVLMELRHLDVRERSEEKVRRCSESVTSPLERAAHEELRSALEKALESLPERRREAILLVRLQGFSLREAADLMGVSRRTVANHVYMAVCDLEEALRSFLS